MVATLGYELVRGAASLAGTLMTRFQLDEP